MPPLLRTKEKIFLDAKKIEVTLQKKKKKVEMTCSWHSRSLCGAPEETEM